MAEHAYQLSAAQLVALKELVIVVAGGGTATHLLEQALPADVRTVVLDHMHADRSALGLGKAGKGKKKGKAEDKAAGSKRKLNADGTEKAQRLLTGYNVYLQRLQAVSGHLAEHEAVKAVNPDGMLKAMSIYGQLWKSLADGVKVR